MPEVTAHREPGVQFPADWATAHAYRHYPKAEDTGDVRIAIWAPAPEADASGSLSGLGLIAIEADPPRKIDTPYVHAAVDGLARIAENSPGAANLLAILGIAALVTYDYADNRLKHTHLRATFPNVATLNSRLRWIGEQLDPPDTPPRIVAAHGKYTPSQFMDEPWPDDEVLMTTAEATAGVPRDHAVLYAAHDMLTHAPVWAMLTSATRRAMRDGRLDMDQIDGFVAPPTVEELFDHQRGGSTMLIFSSGGIFDQPNAGPPNPLLDGQLARFTALEHLPPTPFPDPRAILASSLALRATP